MFFQNHRAASLYLKAYHLENTHEIITVTGGFEIWPIDN